jgi:NitT/TauT family transport system substrate-binding protein
MQRSFSRLVRRSFIALSALIATGQMALSAEQTIRVGGLTEPLIIAEAKGWFREAGLKVAVVDVKNFMQYPNMLASDSIDMLDGYVPANLWNMIDSGADFKIIAGSALAVAERNGKPARNIRGYVVRKDLFDNGTVRKVADLKGRRLADFAPVPPKGQISPFPIGHKVFGDTYKEIDWVRMSESDALNALTAKTIDGARMRSRWVKLAVQNGVGVELARETDYVPLIQVRAIVARNDFLKAHKDAVVAFLRVYLRAQAYAAEVQAGQHREEYLAAVKAHSDIPPEAALDLIQESEFSSELALDDLKATQEHFVMVGAQKAVVPLDRVIDTSYLDAARK